VILPGEKGIFVMPTTLQEVFGVSKQRVLSYLEREAVDGFL
jgi:hypothetical protein